MISYRLQGVSESEQMRRGETLLGIVAQRRSCRFFSDRPVPREAIEKALEIAHTAPSGANRRGWRFVVADDVNLKRRIRKAAEAEERESYERRMTEDWRAALEPIGTDWQKPFLETVPYLVIMFQLNAQVVDGRMQRNYYPTESIGLAAGFFLLACQYMGLATLTHTPSPMNFLRDILKRPSNEKPFLLIPVGYPTDDCVVPDIPKKPLDEVLQWNA